MYEPPTGGYIVFGVNQTIYGMENVTVRERVRPEVKLRLSTEMAETMGDEKMATAIQEAVRNDSIHLNAIEKYTSHKVDISNHLPTIFGGVGGGCTILVLVLVGLCYCYCKKKHGNNNKHENQPSIHFVNVPPGTSS